jgi:hypothetical protein
MMQLDASRWQVFSEHLLGKVEATVIKLHVGITLINVEFLGMLKLYSLFHKYTSSLTLQLEYQLCMFSWNSSCVHIIMSL